MIGAIPGARRASKERSLLALRAHFTSGRLFPYDHGCPANGVGFAGVGTAPGLRCYFAGRSPSGTAPSR